MIGLMIVDSYLCSSIEQCKNICSRDTFYFARLKVVENLPLRDASQAHLCYCLLSEICDQITRCMCKTSTVQLLNYEM